MIVGLAFLFYAFGVLGAMSLYVAAIKADPACMPGGGRAAVVAISLLWPLVAIAAVVGLILYGVSEL